MVNQRVCAVLNWLRIHTASPGLIFRYSYALLAEGRRLRRSVAEQMEGGGDQAKPSHGWTG